MFVSSGQQQEWDRFLLIWNDCDWHAASAHGTLVLDLSPTAYSLCSPLPLNLITCNFNVLHPEPHTKLYNMVNLDGLADLGLEKNS